MGRIYATYEVESPVGLDRAAAVMAGEQSSGTFLKLPSETTSLREEFGARVESTTLQDELPFPSLPCRIKAECFSRGEVVLSWPLENTGPSLPNILATVAGNLFELAELSALRLKEIALPDALADTYPGPAYGRKGTLDLAGVDGRPMIGTIVKPSVGLSPENTAELVAALIESGIDFIKDDELQSDGRHCPFDDRVEKVMAAVNADAEKTGRKVMYAFNVTGEIDEMLRRTDKVKAAGGTCVMVSLFSVGLPGLAALRRHCDLPIHGHRNGWGVYSRSPDIGIDYRVWQTFWRLAGADHLHVNGLSNKFTETDETVVANARSLGAALHSGKTGTAMPVFSAGQTALQMAPTCDAIGHTEFLLCAGGGIIGHPGGPAAGVASLRQAADASVQGIPIDVYARDHKELAQALSHFKDRVTQ